MARSFVKWDDGFLGLLVDWSSRDRNHWAWSHVISLCEGKLVTGQIVTRLEAMK